MPGSARRPPAASRGPSGSPGQGPTRRSDSGECVFPSDSQQEGRTRRFRKREWVDIEGPDAFVARLATRQRGAVAYWQLRDAGLGEGAIAWRVQRGRLHRVHRGVYLVGHWAEAPLARLAAALLAAGPDALLSWHAGLALYELRPIPLADIDVTVPPGHRGRRAGLRIHRCRLPSDQIRTRQGLRCTSPARSIVDVAPHLPTTELDPLVATSLRRRLTTKAELIEAARGRRGARRLRELLQGDGPKFTRSRAEERLLTLVRAAGLPTPLVNERVAGHEVDVLWPRHRLVAEVDGFAYHSDREAFDTDRRRDLDLHAAGLEVVRLTWRQLTDEPELLVARLAAAIERRTALAV